MKKPYQILVIPLTIWSGFEQGFFASDYTAGYVSCVLGVHNVGWVLITYGVFDAVCSVSFGAIIKHTGRVPIFLLGASINLIVVIIFFDIDIMKFSANVLKTCKGSSVVFIHWIQSFDLLGMSSWH